MYAQIFRIAPTIEDSVVLTAKHRNYLSRIHTNSCNDRRDAPFSKRNRHGTNERDSTNRLKRRCVRGTSVCFACAPAGAGAGQPPVNRAQAR